MIHVHAGRFNEESRELRALGSEALLDDLLVRVIAVQVQLGPRVVYEITWTLNSRRCVEWVEECELEDALDTQPRNV